MLLISQTTIEVEQLKDGMQKLIENNFEED
jgi:hypothetical protein